MGPVASPGDIYRLQQLAKDGEARQAAEAAERPKVEAGTRLHRTWERVLAAARTIQTGQEDLQKDMAVHRANGAPAEFFEPVAELSKPECRPTVADYDAANEKASVLATKLEVRAHKIRSYLNACHRQTRAARRACGNHRRIGWRYPAWLLAAQRYKA